MKAIKYMLLLVAFTMILAGCGSKETVSEESSTEVVVESATDVNETEPNVNDAHEVGLSDISALIGMKDEDTAELLGGGEENWSEDKEFYIGRIYSVDMDGETYRVYTTCGDDNIVESVSIWIVNGERDVTDEEAQEWKDRVTGFMGAEPMEDPEISEGGSRNSHWRANGLAASMHQMKDILTISIQPAVGELK